jgi:hypothetical protein
MMICGLSGFTAKNMLDRPAAKQSERNQLIERSLFSRSLPSKLIRFVGSSPGLIEETPSFEQSGGFDKSRQAAYSRLSIY